PPAVPEPSATVGSSDTVGLTVPIVSVPPLRAAVQTSPTGAVVAGAVDTGATGAAVVARAVVFFVVAGFFVVFADLLVVFVAAEAGPTSAAPTQTTTITDALRADLVNMLTAPKLVRTHR